MTGFYSPSQQDLVARSQAESPLVAQALDQSGIGRAYGTQFLLRQQQVGPLLRLDQLQHPAQRAEGRAGPRLAPLRLRPDARLHGARLVRPRRTASRPALRFRFATGYPRTPVIGAYFDAQHRHVRADLRRAQLDPHPAVRRRSTRASPSASSSADDELEVYLDVQNVTNHSNPEEIVYNTNYTQRGYITGLPILPVARREVLMVRRAAMAPCVGVPSLVAAARLPAEPRRHVSHRDDAARCSPCSRSPPRRRRRRRVTYTALVVDGSGAGAGAPRSVGLLQRAQPALEPRPVSPQCVGAGQLGARRLGAGPRAPAAIPAIACRNFGPERSAGHRAARRRGPARSIPTRPAGTTSR